jgi:putative transposase
MARPLRIELAGGLYHVMSRGNERRAIVRDDADRQRRLDWLRRTVETYGWRLHAFVLMSNHEHLFVETPEPNLSAGLHLLNGSYTGYFNLRHRRAGHLFQGRFKAHLVEEEGYFTEISRYIHLNPVRAKLVAKPEQWRWSSYPGYRSSRAGLEWVTYERVLGEFGGTATEARQRYRRFVEAGVTEPPRSPWKNALGGVLLGSEAFAIRVRLLLGNRQTDLEVPQLQRLRARPSLQRIVAVVAEHFDCLPADWSSGRRCDSLGRAAAAYLARRRYGYSAVAIARALGYGRHSSVAAAVARVEAAGKSVGERIAALEKDLANG